MAWPSTPDELGKHIDGRFGLRVHVIFMCDDQMFLCQVESCMLRICEEVVARHRGKQETSARKVCAYFPT